MSDSGLLADTIALTTPHRKTPNPAPDIPVDHGRLDGRSAALPEAAVRRLRSPRGSGLIAGTDDPLQGGAHDRCCASDLDLEAFARWFADWWLRRGRDLTDPTQHGR
ncbi:MAG TPA: hypothetical protein VIH71_15650 [Solirubrobacteraceae bacterium]